MLKKAKKDQILTSISEEVTKTKIWVKIYKIGEITRKLLLQLANTRVL